MWICSTLGYFSIVQSDRDENAFLVRARTPEDLKILKRETGLENEIVVLPDTDYAARLIVTWLELDAIFDALRYNIDYSNFKNKIYKTPEQKDKADCYGKIWEVMHGYQERRGRD